MVNQLPWRGMILLAMLAFKPRALLIAVPIVIALMILKPRRGSSR